MIWQAWVLFEAISFRVFFFFFVDSGSKKGMDARRSRTIKIGQSRRKSRTYQPTTSTYLVDLLEQQPATICSEKGKNPVLPGKTRVCPSRLNFFQFRRAGFMFVYWYCQWELVTRLSIPIQAIEIRGWHYRIHPSAHRTRCCAAQELREFWGNKSSKGFAGPGLAGSRQKKIHCRDVIEMPSDAMVTWQSNMVHTIHKKDIIETYVIMVILGGWFIIGFTTLWQILTHEQPSKNGWTWEIRIACENMSSYYSDPWCCTPGHPTHEHTNQDKLKNLQTLVPKCGDNLFVPARLSKVEAQATLQRLLIAGGCRCAEHSCREDFPLLALT